MRRATLRSLKIGAFIISISIHALHEESDWSTRHRSQSFPISIHALHEESDDLTYNSCNFQYVFQSTLSMRRATQCQRRTVVHGHISIHALHEESDSGLRWRSVHCQISIHALHEESDRIMHVSVYGFPCLFQSTLSMRRATRVLTVNPHGEAISIHALHEESDRIPAGIRRNLPHFNPRSP